jgi:hypothetical protein
MNRLPPAMTAFLVHHSKRHAPKRAGT